MSETTTHPQVDATAGTPEAGPTRLDEATATWDAPLPTDDQLDQAAEQARLAAEAADLAAQPAPPAAEGDDAARDDRGRRKAPRPDEARKDRKGRDRNDGPSIGDFLGFLLTGTSEPSDHAYILAEFCQDTGDKTIGVAVRGGNGLDDDDAVRAGLSCALRALDEKDATGVSAADMRDRHPVPPYVHALMRTLCGGSASVDFNGEWVPVHVLAQLAEFGLLAGSVEVAAQDYPIIPADDTSATQPAPKPTGDPGEPNTEADR